jgi:hypothetical protein
VGGSEEGKGVVFYSSCVWCGEGRGMDAPKFYGRNYKMYFLTILVGRPHHAGLPCKGTFCKTKNPPSKVIITFVCDTSILHPFYTSMQIMNTIVLAKFVACCQYQRTICPS